jgi:hypothetical protein
MSKSLMTGIQQDLKQTIVGSLTKDKRTLL